MSDMVNAQTNEGLTPLHIAAIKGHLDICQLLFAYGADPHIRDRRGFTALQFAEFQGHERVAHLIRAMMKEAPDAD